MKFNPRTTTIHAAPLARGRIDPEREEPPSKKSRPSATHPATPVHISAAAAIKPKENLNVIIPEGTSPLSYTLSSPCPDQFYPPQYNIAVEVLKQFESSGAYSLDWTERRINLLVIGPAPADLQAQTEGAPEETF